MSLIKCKECGAEMSDRAESCPRCGSPNKQASNVWLWVILVILVLILAGGITWWFFWKSDNVVEVQDEDTPTSLEYYLESSSENQGNNILCAKVNGERKEILRSDDYRISIDMIDDFDNDGMNEALVSLYGLGQIEKNQYFFIIYNNDGTFTQTSKFGYSKEEPKFSIIDDEKVVEVANEGYTETTWERYALRNGVAVKLEMPEPEKPKVLAELTNATADSGGKISFDLDENGEMDAIEARGTSSAGYMHVSVILNGKEVWFGGAVAKIIGVLSTKTNGMHDLLYDNESTAKWNGQEYAIN